MHRTMRQHLKALLSTLFLGVCFCCCVAAESKSVQEYSYNNNECKSSVVTSQHERHQAAFACMQELARICCSLPVRTISPLEQTPTQRINIRTQKLFNLQKVSFLNYRGLGKWLSSPMVSPSPRVYYVFTWRHLLC